jgi:hypothetical protein
MQQRSSRLGAHACVVALMLSAGVVACSGDGADGASGGGALASNRSSGNGPNACPAPAAGVDVGTFVGDALPDLTVKDCDGNDVSLKQYCGANAMWLYVVHTWCPHCNKVGDYAEKLASSYTSKNVVSLQIVYQNAKHAPATAEDCKQWRDDKNLSNAITLYDPGGVTKQLNDSTFTSLSLYIDKQRIIRGKSHTDDDASIRQGIDALLSQK